MRTRMPCRSIRPGWKTRPGRRRCRREPFALWCWAYACLLRQLGTSDHASGAVTRQDFEPCIDDDRLAMLDAVMPLQDQLGGAAPDLVTRNFERGQRGAYLRGD